MDKHTILKKTRMGKELLDNPGGRISGDEVLLLAMVDGRTSLAGITKKVPPSVGAKLDAIFSHMLSTNIIAEAGNTEIPQPAPSEQTPEETNSPEHKSNDGLEQKLENACDQLEATKTRLKEAEVCFNKLRLRVSAYTEITNARLSKRVDELASIPADELRKVYEHELHEVIAGLQPLNQVIAEQKHLLESTLRLKILHGQPSAEQLQKEHEAHDAKLAYSHPLYKRLRGLEFFRGFANAELLQFLNIAKWLEAEAGSTVLNEGDVGMPFYIIVSGTVEVFKGEHKLATLNQGDFFGEFAYLSGDEPYRSARVVAETDCEFLEVDPLEIEFSHIQFRLHVVEALLRGQVRRTLISPGNLQSGNLSGEPEYRNADPASL